MVPLNELRRAVAQHDLGQMDELEQDLISSLNQARLLRGDVDNLRAEIVFKEAASEDATAEKTSLKAKEMLLRAVEKKLSWLRRELYYRDPKKYSFLRC